MTIEYVASEHLTEHIFTFFFFISPSNFQNLKKARIPTVAVDIPSGWNVDEGKKTFLF